MKRVFLTLVVFALATVAANDAFAWPRLFRRYAPAYATPAPTVVVQPQGGYRSFSYEPGPVATGTYRNYGPSVRRTPNAFGDATRKALGNY
jgi:hypothetical protein